MLQVISGGHYDVDCYVQDPLGSTVYSETRKQYDSFTHRAAHAGVYQFCFSNEFSTFSHKTVYFDFRVGDEPPILPEMGGKVTALTQVSAVLRAPPREQSLSTGSPSAACVGSVPLSHRPRGTVSSQPCRTPAEGTPPPQASQHRFPLPGGCPSSRAVCLVRTQVPLWVVR